MGESGRAGGEEGKERVNQRNEGRKAVSEQVPNQNTLIFTVLEYSV